MIKTIKYAFLFVLSIASLGAFANVNNVQIAEVWAGGYFDGSRAYTRIRLDRALPSNRAACAINRTIVVIRSGAVSGNNSDNNIIATEYYQQQYAAALAAVINGSAVDVNVTNQCTSDSQFAVINRITVKP